MTMPSPSDGSPRVEGHVGGDAPFLPPARAATPAVTMSVEPAMLTVPALSADAPVLPSSRPPEPPAAPTAPVFDAKAMVESQKHFNANPAYGAMPAGSEESRAAARQLREQANRKRRRGKAAGRIVGVLVLAGLAVGAYFAYRAIQDDPPPADGTGDPADADVTDAVDGEGGALTPLGEQVQVIDALDDVNSGATPSAGALLDAVDDAREVVGQSEPPVAGAGTVLVADVLTPAVLDHTDVLDPTGGWERFVVRTADLTAVDPAAHTALVERLAAMPQVADGDAQLAEAPVVLPGDIGIAIQREGDTITRLVAVAADPTIRAVGP